MAVVLKQGFISCSTLFASAGFFFVEKKDGRLRPCIDYPGLNMVMVKYPHLFPLILSVIKQLRGSKLFTKMDLQSMYNLVWIRACDKWKTEFKSRFRFTSLPI